MSLMMREMIVSRLKEKENGMRKTRGVILKILRMSRTKPMSISNSLLNRLAPPSSTLIQTVEYGAKLADGRDDEWEELEETLREEPLFTTPLDSEDPYIIFTRVFTGISSYLLC
jgi:hypothetical protein